MITAESFYVADGCCVAAGTKKNLLGIQPPEGLGDNKKPPDGGGWCAHLDLNQGPTDYESVALTD